VDLAIALITLFVGLLGVVVGGFLTRRNEKRSQGERLLVEALNDAATAIAEVANGVGPTAQHRYASAISRIALHGSPSVIAAFREFQDDATTSTDEGRARLLAAVQQARQELGHVEASDQDIAVLLFGSTEPKKRFCPRCGSDRIRPGEETCFKCSVPERGLRAET
jgi:hypothetical protein